MIKLISEELYEEAQAQPATTPADGIIGELAAPTGSRMLRGRSGWAQWLSDGIFVHNRGGYSRFSTPEFGAWYCAREIEAAEAEIQFHKSRELSSANIPGGWINYRPIEVQVTGEFEDLRGSDEAKQLLGREPETDYEVSQAYATNLYRSGSQGIIFPCVRCQGGICMAIFDPNAIGQFAAGDVLPVLIP